jgi:hypothetical protein
MKGTQSSIVGMDVKGWKCGIKCKWSGEKMKNLCKRDEIGAYEKDENV